MAEDFIKRYRSKRQREQRFYASQPSLAAAIEAAALAKKSNGKMSSHQTRWASVLPVAARALLGAPLTECKTFEALYQTVERTIGQIRGIGGLTIYDTAHRMGAFLGLEPEQVYLHRGTQAGAKALGLDHRRDSLQIDELPRPLRKLSAAELEDFLCIYKDDLGVHRVRAARSRATR